MIPEYMHSFSRDAQKSSRDPTQPPNVIRASKLDGNFRACLPMKLDGRAHPYKVIANEHGWRLEGGALFDVCENGKPVQYRLFGIRVAQVG